MLRMLVKILLREVVALERVKVVMLVEVIVIMAVMEVKNNDQFCIFIDIFAIQLYIYIDKIMYIKIKLQFL